MPNADDSTDADPQLCDWRLTSWRAGITQTHGFGALILFGTGLVVLLTPTVVLAGYSVYSHRPALLVFVFFSLWGFFHASPGPTGIGLIANFIVAVIGHGIAVGRRDPLIAASGLLSGFTWFGTCAYLGITSQFIWEAVQSSPRLFRTLVEAGVLERIPFAESSQPPDRLVERDSGEESSLTTNLNDFNV